MTETKAKDSDLEKLVQDTPIVSLDIPVSKTPRTKKRIRRIADPHLEGRKINGSLYYYYRRGIDKPIYLGSADAILRAVKRHGV
jgi:hypothetical protein